MFEIYKTYVGLFITQNVKHLRLKNGLSWQKFEAFVTKMSNILDANDYDYL